MHHPAALKSVRPFRVLELKNILHFTTQVHLDLQRRLTVVDLWWAGREQADDLKMRPLEFVVFRSRVRERR